MARRWGLRRWLAFVVGLVVLACTPVMAGAAALTPAQLYQPIGLLRFCPDAQLQVANIDDAPGSAFAVRGISIGATIYNDFTVSGSRVNSNDFADSKPAVDLAHKRIMTTMGVVYADAARTEPEMIVCKLRTAESLAKGAWPSSAPDNGGRFAVDRYFGLGANGVGLATSPTDQPCSVVNQSTITSVWDSLTPSQQASSPYKPTDGSLVTVPDTLHGASGPAWTAVSATGPLQLTDGVLQVRSESLLVPTGSSGSRDARLEGAHYCTFVAPTYLRDVLLGNQQIGAGAPTGD